MSKVISIGEALIDFIPQEKGISLKDVSNFLRVPGGAPLNVAAAVAKLGGKSQMLTKLGYDSFGDAILEEVKPLGVDVSRIERTRKVNTASAFVSLKEDGERDFSFYRNPSADMLLSESEIFEEDFKERCREAILEFLPCGNILKISDEELEFISGIKNEEEALNSLLFCNATAALTVSKKRCNRSIANKK